MFQYYNFILLFRFWTVSVPIVFLQRPTRKCKPQSGRQHKVNLIKARLFLGGIYDVRLWTPRLLRERIQFLLFRTFLEDKIDKADDFQQKLKFWWIYQKGRAFTHTSF